MGVVATLTMVIAYLTIVARGFRICKTNKGTPFASGALFFSIWVICLMLWSNTADVFANSIVTTLGYALSGATLCSLRFETDDGVPP